MNVLAVTLINFTAHKHSVLKLPKTGVLLITGVNGAGKSSFVEGVAFAGWGKTLRGTVPWKGEAKPPCSASISTDYLNITRSREGKKTKLEWEDFEAAAQDLPGARSDDPEYDTPTKANEALLNLLGPFDLWRRSHVFSSADAAHFTTASDGERKRLIETFLGNDRFDPALEACRADLKKARERMLDLERKQEVAETKLTGAKQRLADTKRQLESLAEPPPPPNVAEGKSLKELDEALSRKRRDVSQLREGLRQADRKGGEHEATAKMARQMLERLRADKCPTCERPITPDMRRAEQVKADRASALMKEAKESVAAARADVEQALEETEKAIAHLQKERDARSRELAVVEHARQERVRYEAQVKSLTAALRSAEQEASKLKTTLVDIEDELDIVAQDVDELEAVEVVLGVKGVRAHILGKSLGGIEAVANVWLAKFYTKPVRVSLKPYSELKKGGFDDSISFEVEGVGDGLGYKATSGGERRRLDVAMLLAMAEVAAAARGLEAGTLWFDECLDALDEPGTEAVISALQDLAATRCVVVITHSVFLKERLRVIAASHVHVTDGSLQVL